MRATNTKYQTHFNQNSCKNNLKFEFKFFISKDNHNIRWGYMPALIAEGDLKKRGIILLLNGRTEFMEKYNSIASKLASMGYDVMSLDWRGQGLSVRELLNRDKGYVKDFNLYISDLELFYNLYVLPHAICSKLTITIVAHSMGGHIALRFLSEHSKSRSFEADIKNAILISPMIDIITSPIKQNFAKSFTDWASRQLAYLAIRFGFDKTYIPGGKDYSIKDVKFKDNPLTNDWDNFWLEHKEIAKNRNLALGGVTWGWLKAAFDSISILNDKRYLASIKTPVWIFSAKEDSVVSNKAQQRACKIIQNGKFISIKKAKHEILFETDEVRKGLWKKINSIILG
ncbi:MAG: alpha/beta hydrolase [Desulfamplus sp.]|nr:alpha/beta hydrolase [Desulfamplus sp.]